MKSKKGFKSFLFTLFIIASISFISYGVYTYIKDFHSPAEKPISQEPSPDSGPTPPVSSTEVPPTANNTDANTDASSEGPSAEDLDRNLEEQVKTEARTSVPVETSAHGSLALPLIDVSFSTYSSSDQTLSLGVTFASSITSAENCILNIQNNNQTIEKSVKVMNQPQLKGCRFNTLDLSQLTVRPSSHNPWLLTITAYSAGGIPATQTLSKNITSLNALNSLNT